MALIYISNGTIEEISEERGTRFVTITYVGNQNDRREEQTVRLVVNTQTIILNANGTAVDVSNLKVGMLVNAVFSQRMARSNPPQAMAYVIEIIRRGAADQNQVTRGTILDIDRRNRSFVTIGNGNLSSMIRFRVSEDTLIFNREGRPIVFGRLLPGMQVQVRHTNVMTASIPPQTTALEIQVL